MVNKIKDESEPLSGKLFRPKIVVDQIAAVPKEPGYIYKGVAMNYEHLPYNVENHEKVGYEIVYTKEQMKDDRTFAPDSNQSDSMRFAPVIKTTSKGTQYLLMRITEENFQKYMQDCHDKDALRYRQSLRSQKRSGQEIRQDGGDINTFNK